MVQGQELNLLNFSFHYQTYILRSQVEQTCIVVEVNKHCINCRENTVELFGQFALLLIRYSNFLPSFDEGLELRFVVIYTY